MSLVRLSNLLRERRGSLGVREVAAEIGISPATLSRVESGKSPDLLTFRRLCAWLKVDPAEILDIAGETQAASPPSVAVHLRADGLLSQDAASDLAQLILAAHRELARRNLEKRTDVSPWF